MNQFKHCSERLCRDANKFLGLHSVVDIQVYAFVQISLHIDACMRAIMNIMFAAHCSMPASIYADAYRPLRFRRGSRNNHPQHRGQQQHFPK